MLSVVVPKYSAVDLVVTVTVVEPIKRNFSFKLETQQNRDSPQTRKKENNEPISSRNLNLISSQRFFPIFRTYSSYQINLLYPPLGRCDFRSIISLTLFFRQDGKSKGSSMDKRKLRGLELGRFFNQGTLKGEVSLYS
jgi:hypothetical protein